jgi:hypothetical protein
MRNAVVRLTTVRSPAAISDPAAHFDPSPRRRQRPKRCPPTLLPRSRGTIEEVVYQRQLSKEGLQSIVVDDKEQLNSMDADDLRVTSNIHAPCNLQLST